MMHLAKVYSVALTLSCAVGFSRALSTIPTRTFVKRGGTGGCAVIPGSDVTIVYTCDLALCICLNSGETMTGMSSIVPHW